MRTFALSLAVVFSLTISSFGLYGEFAFARGGDEVGNGGGLAEKNFRIALERLSEYARPCIETDACRLDDRSRQTLGSVIETALPAALKSANALIFKSEKNNPGLFIINGEVKIAKTGSRPGDAIYINTDLLYQKTRFGEYEAMSVSDAVAVLIHELGHHVSTRSHEDLDLIGVRVSLRLQQRMQKTPILPWKSDISLTVVQSANESSGFPQLLLNVGSDVFDLSREFEKSVFCPAVNIPIILLPFPDLQFGQIKPKGSIFHNVHWDKAEKDGSDGEFSVVGNLTHICESDMSFLAVNSFRARISFQVNVQSAGELKIVADSIEIHQSYEPWYKLIRFPF